MVITGDVRGEDGSPFLVGLNPRGYLWRFALQAGKKQPKQRTSCHRSHPALCAPAHPLKQAEKWGGHINPCKSFGCPEQARLVMPTEAQDVLANTA